MIGWFGRMTAVKRTDDLVDVLVALRARGVDACLLLVGDGTDRERLEQRARDAGVARDVFFLGYQKDVASLYAIADAVVLTSVNEGTPVTIIEALAAGRPIVATDVGGVAGRRSRRDRRLPRGRRRYGRDGRPARRDLGRPCPRRAARDDRAGSEC